MQTRGGLKHGKGTGEGDAGTWEPHGALPVCYSMLVLRFMVGLQAHSVRLGTLARRRPLAGSKQGGCWAQARALSQCPRQGGFLCAAASIYPYVAVCVSGAVGERTAGR